MEINQLTWPTDDHLYSPCRELFNQTPLMPLHSLYHMLNQFGVFNRHTERSGNVQRALTYGDPDATYL